jgi:threonylcarbamoyladenosine tRNA methylthiotransferase CDKAL1
MRFYIETYGCVLNQHDSELLKELLLSAGYDLVLKEEEADFVIINTCGVKDATEKRMINRLKSITKPLIVCGCLPSGNSQYLRKFVPNAVFLGTYSLQSVIDAVNYAIDYNGINLMKKQDKNKLEYSYSKPIEILAIGDGCTSYCTYCFTRLARKGLISMPINKVLKRVEDAVKADVKELRTTSQDVGAYGIDLNTNITQLLKKITELDTKDMEIRIGMMNPKHLIDNMEVIDIINENDVFYNFFHIPIQSGSNEILKEMKRENSVDDYININNEIRKDKFNNVMTDFIIGFPGETEQNHQESIELIKKTQPDTVNVSKYSARKGTIAAKMKQVDRHVINARSIEMSLICNDIAKKRNEMYLGKEVEFTVLEQMKGYVGRNKYYKQVVIENSEIGKREKVKISSCGTSFIKGYSIQ